VNYSPTFEVLLTSKVLNKIPIKEAKLFRSYAHGKNHEWSDIDIALVSEIFIGIRIDDKDKIRNITLAVNSALFGDTLAEAEQSIREALELFFEGFDEIRKLSEI